MEDDNKVSADSEDFQKAEDVQQEAESNDPKENNTDANQLESEPLDTVSAEVEATIEKSDTSEAEPNSTPESTDPPSEDDGVLASLDSITPEDTVEATDSPADTVNESGDSNPQVEIDEVAAENQPEVTSQEPELEEESKDEEPAVETESVEGTPEEEENEYDHIDTEGASRGDLLDLIKRIAKEENHRKTDRLFKEITARHENLFNAEKQEALEAFLKEEGAKEEDFEFKIDKSDQEFQTISSEIRMKRSHFFHQLEKEKEENLTRKEQILDMIREIVDGEDQSSFNKVKQLQEEWKKVGPVPGAQNRTLWANYHALMDRFYDQRTIYFELKDLDRKKNLQAKLELCERAESLNPEKDLHTSISLLNELHDEFKHIGPVPKEDQEPLWQRFKAASDKVYEHRRAFTDQQKEEHLKNLDKKKTLAAKVEEFAGFESDRIKTWNQKTKELLELQKEWESVGGVPRDKAKEVNKAFWGGFKKFFANKNTFFKSLDSQREDNLKKKQELVERAAELKENSDWDNTARALKELQQEWREIGPVPEKFRKSVYEEFKGHCDHFFERRRGQNEEQNQEFQENLEAKMSLLDQLQEIADADKLDLDLAYSITERFSELGLVPRNAVAKVLDRYDAIGNKILANDSLSDTDQREFKMHLDISKLKNTPHGGKKINRKESTLRRKIQGLENDISTWKTNVDFFGRSKNAELMKKDIEEKIVAAEQELESLKQQLRMIH